MFNLRTLSSKLFANVRRFHTELTPVAIEKFRQSFYADSKNQLALNVCTKHDPLELCLKRSVLETEHHAYTHKIEAEGKPVSNQKSSGRCWIFACLNVIRLPYVKALNVEEFEFSQAFLFYWDKIERSNYFLNTVVEAARRGEEVTGRLVSHLLSDPIGDGGQWDMLVNLINKYGLMPKKCFPESFSCESSAALNGILRSKLREFTSILYSRVGNGETEAGLRDHITQMMNDIHRIVGICLGIPPSSFTWEYYDKNKVYNKVGPISPVDFYQNHIKTHFDVNSKVCLVSDPRSTSPYGRLYTVDCLGNVVGGRIVTYNNQPVDVIARAAIDSIKAGEAVWFGCDFGKHLSRKQGFNIINCQDFELVFGVSVCRHLSKAERMVYGDSRMSHAMTLTAVTLDESDNPTRWRIENSWGDDKGEKGYVTMSQEWFNEFTYEVVVDRKYLGAEVLEVLNQEPIVLPAWDPMGSLA